MRVAVIGAGIIGVTTAFELAADGHEVTVFERRASVAEETSFANAGVVAPGYVTPWAAPGMPAKVARFLLSEHAPVRVTLPLSRDDIAWMWKWYRPAISPPTWPTARACSGWRSTAARACTRSPSTSGSNTSAASGYMVLLRGEKDRKLVQPGLQVLRDAGVSFKEIDAEEARKIEPALNPETAFAGAIHLPNDEVGNCRQFALLLQERGPGAAACSFEFNSGGGTAGSGRAGARLHVWTLGDACADAAALRGRGGLRRRRLGRAAAAAGPAHSAGAGVWLFDQRAASANRSMRRAARVMDERYKVAISRLGNRVRVAGSAEIGGSPENKRSGLHRRRSTRCCTTGSRARRNLPTPAPACRNGKARGPMLPDGPPMIGATGIPGVWINLGHGSSGWALSCGSARVVADLMGGHDAGSGHRRARHRAPAAGS